MYINKLLFYSILLASLGCSSSYASTATTIANEAATKTGVQIAKETLSAMAEAAPYVALAVQAYSVATEVQPHVCPTEEQAARANAVNEMHALLTAEKQFQNCLLKNKDSSARETSGRPTACEEFARMFVMLGGKKEVDNMTTIYNQFRKKKDS